MSSEMITRKFEVWDPISKCFWNIKSSWCITPDGKVAVTDPLSTCDEVILIQHLGKMDKNDKDIREGDIIKFPIQWWYKGSISDKYQVAVVEPPLGVKLFHNGDWTVEPEICEVIGNIYENPELLK